MDSVARPKLCNAAHLLEVMINIYDIGHYVMTARAFPVSEGLKKREK